jgi:chemotaxis protein CheD
MQGLAEAALATNLYFDRYHGCDAAKILPGEYYVTDQSMLLVTVLGSCVSACIRDPGNGIGGLNHFMLPNTGQDTRSPLSTSARYGSHAMELLINQLLKLGARRPHLEAKLFGGGNVLPGLTVTEVGTRNAAFARDYLAAEGIPVAAQDLEDVHPRKVYFFPATGRVLVKRLKTLHNRTLLEREQAYRGRLAESPVAGVVELFT